MIDKNVTTFDHLCVQDLLGRTSLTLKHLWIYHRSTNTSQTPVNSYGNKNTEKASTNFRHKSYTTHSIRKFHTSYRSNHKLTSLLLKERIQDKIWPQSHLTYQRTHNRDHINREHITQRNSQKWWLKSASQACLQ